MRGEPMIEKRYSDLESVSHAHLIGVTQEHVVHVGARLGERDERHRIGIRLASRRVHQDLDVRIGLRLDAVPEVAPKESMPRVAAGQLAENWKSRWPDAIRIQ